MWETLISPRIRLKDLIGLCRRMGTSLEAGIDARTAWAREAERAVGSLRHRLSGISRAVNRGDALSDALAETGEFFPAIFREMTAVGEQTGHLDRVLAQLAEHYQSRLSLRRAFLVAIAWPVFQLVVSVGVIGVLIWVMGMLPTVNGQPTDILGFGLVGDRGLRIYLTFWAVVVVAGWLIVRAIQRGLAWTHSIQRLILRIPMLGGPLQTIALERLAWSMHLTMNTDMDVRRSLRLSLRGTQNARYLDQIPMIDAEIVAGNSIYEAFRAAGGYPTDFLDTLAVGEQSGKISESMGVLAKQYQERARMAMAALAIAAGWIVWAVIAAFIIVLIFRVASFYVNTIYSFMPK